MRGIRRELVWPKLKYRALMLMQISEPRFGQTLSRQPKAMKVKKWSGTCKTYKSKSTPKRLRHLNYCLE